MINEASIINNNVPTPKFKSYCLYLYITISLILLFISPFFFLLFVSVFSPFMPKAIIGIFSPLVLVIAISFYASLQPFSDLAEYMNVYHQINSGEIGVFGYERFGYGIEFFILLLMKIAAVISNGNDQFFLLTVYSLIFTLLYLISRKIDKKFHLLIFLCFFVSLGFVESLSYFLRQNISVLFFLYGLLCVRTKTARYFFFLLSLTSHISAAINIFIYFFAKKYKKRINTNQRIIKFSLLIMAGAIFTALFLIIVPFGQVLYDKALYVVTNAQYSSLPLPYVFITLVNTIFIVIFSMKYRQSNTVIYYLFIKEIFLFYLTISLPAVPNRLGMLLFSYAYLFLLFIYESPVSNKNRYIISIFFLIINAIPFMYSMYIISNKGNDLTFFMNQPLTLNTYELTNNLYDNLKYGVQYLDNGNNL